MLYNHNMDTPVFTPNKDSVSKAETGSVQGKGVSIMMNAYFTSKEPQKLNLEDNEKEFSFQSNLQYWNNSTRFLSANNYDNSYFNAIVDMGENAVPFIKQELQKGPTSLVHALDLIFPGRVVFKGYVSLKRACEVWLGVLSR